LGLADGEVLVIGPGYTSCESAENRLGLGTDKGLLCVFVELRVEKV